MAKLLSSPLVSASNNIVLFAKGTKTLPKVQKELVQFNQFLQLKTVELEKLKLPEKKKIKELANLNIASSFGAPGGLLRSLASGALDVAGFLGNMFPAKGKTGKPGKPGKVPKKIKVPKPAVRGSKLKLGGIRAVGVVNALFAGLDFATGLQEGESVGKAGAGAIGSAAGGIGGGIAGAMLAGAIGQTLVPIPGLGFVLGAAVGGLGSFAGGYLADRVYEGGSSIKKKLDERLKKQEAKQKGAASDGGNFGDMISKFSSAVSKFEQGVSSGLFGSVSQIGRGQTENKSEINYEPDTKSIDTGNKPESTGLQLEDVEASGGEVPGSPNSGFRTSDRKNHNGNDYFKSAGTPISLIQEGTVTVADMNYNPGGWGALVEVRHKDGSLSRYAHLSKISVSAGSKISPGQVIGYTGGAAGAYGSGNSEGPHLHFEYLPSGSGQVDPTQAAKKIFRFGGNIIVKPKVNAQSGMMGQSGAPTVILAAGTNDYTDPKSGAAGVTKAIKELQAKGYNVVVVPPSEQGAYANVSKSVQEAATASGAKIEKGQYNPNDPTRPYTHLTSQSAQTIQKKYPGAKVIGDSNAELFSGSQSYRGKSADFVASQIKNMQNVAPKPQNPAPTIAPSPPPPQAQVQQYPTYNQQQSSVTIMPIMMGGGNQGGGGQQQKPVYIPVGGGGGGGTVILPGPSEGQVVNSLVKTLLLTTLSGS